jgi:hypothetical protein
MDDFLIYSGIIIIFSALEYVLIMYSIQDARKTIVAKQDAIMAKLIEIKFR